MSKKCRQGEISIKVIRQKGVNIQIEISPITYSFDHLSTAAKEMVDMMLEKSLS